MYSKVVCFDDFRKSFKISSCKRLFGFQTSESCTATARWPANTTAELAVYWIWKRTEETISRKKLAFVHLRFRVMFRRSNKECHLVFSMKYLLFQGRFGRDERFPFERDERFPFERDERFRLGECGGRRRSKESDMWLVQWWAGNSRHRNDLPRQNCYECNYSAEWWVSTQH